jgi:hypothetical protein
MPNPNNNKHFNDEALRINRELKKENDKLMEQILALKQQLILCIPYSDEQFEIIEKLIIDGGE